MTRLLLGFILGLLLTGWTSHAQKPFDPSTDPLMQKERTPAPARPCVPPKVIHFVEF